MENNFKDWDELFGILAWKFTPTKSGDISIDAEKSIQRVKRKIYFS
jgi:hypothetical protein